MPVGCSLDEVFKQFEQPINNIFTQNLQSKSAKVKTQALKTLLIYLATISDKEFIKKMQGSQILKLIISTMIEAIKFDQDVGK